MNKGWSTFVDPTAPPILLKHIVKDAGISQAELAVAAKVSRPTMSQTLNHGYVPKKLVDTYRTTVEDFIRGNEQAMAVLQQRGNSIAELWSAVEEEVPLPGKLKCSGHGQRVKRGLRLRGIAQGDPDEITEREVEMVRQEALRHWKMFRNPFPSNGGVEKDSDIFRSEEHRYLEAAMLDAAKHGGFLAVIAQVGGGKTIMRKSVMEQLRREGDIQIVFPQILDKRRVSSASLLDAIIMDISDQSPRIKNEHKARQARALLIERSREGKKCCLIIEEAHMLTVPALKMVKQLFEMEDGFKRLLSVVMIGQTELGNLLDERLHPEMREVIRRTQIARIEGLGDNLKPYLEHKFRRIGAKMEDIFTEDAVVALGKRLTGSDDFGRKFSTAYPLTVNNYAIRAMNLAYELGEPVVDAAVVDQL